MLARPAVILPQGRWLQHPFHGVDHAWSVARRLNPTYSGNLIRVRRSSDNAEADIGQTAYGLLDEAAFATHVGSDSAYIVTVYNQVAAGIDLVQATAASQMRLANAGALDTMGGQARPAATVVGASQGMRFTLGAAYTGTTLTAYHAGLGSSAVSSTARHLSVLTAAAGDGSDAGNAVLVARNVQTGADDRTRVIRSGTAGGNVVIPAAAANAWITLFDGAACVLQAARYAGSGGAASFASGAAFAWDRGGWCVTTNAAFASAVGIQAGESALWLSACSPAQRRAILQSARLFWNL